LAVNSTIFSEGEFDQPLTPQDPIAGQAPDVLAYYLPFHFYRNGIWGIYLRAKGILGLAMALKGAAITNGDDDALEAAQALLFEHELFHCLTELAATRAEVIVRSPVYRSYFPDRWANAHEEAMANACGHSKIKKLYPRFIKATETWMRSQPPGYRDFQRYAATRLSRGRLICSQHILRFLELWTPQGSVSRGGGGRYATCRCEMPARLPSRLPSNFLLGKAANVPTYLVVDVAIATKMLRPFQKYKGIVVKVHTREHPPPHIHIERPPGNDLTRYLWPDLKPYPGDKQLSGSEEKDLGSYVDRFGKEIDQKIRTVYRLALQKA